MDSFVVVLYQSLNLRDCKPQTFISPTSAGWKVEDQGAHRSISHSDALSDPFYDNSHIAGEREDNRQLDKQTDG